MVSSLGIFKYSPIISDQELETIKIMSKVEKMPVYPRELLLGSEATLG